MPPQRSVKHKALSLADVRAGKKSVHIEIAELYVKAVARASTTLPMHRLHVGENSLLHAWTSEWVWTTQQKYTRSP
jgi:hypothetical protein